jgi:hypothetical protein
MKSPFVLPSNQVDATPGCDRVLDGVSLYELHVPKEELLSMVEACELTVDLKAEVVAAIENQTSVNLKVMLPQTQV